MGVVLLAGVGVAVYSREWAGGEKEKWEEAQMVGLQTGRRGRGEVVLE